MAASINDYFQKLGGAASLVNTPKVTVVRAAAGATLTVDNCNWDQTTGKRFATFQVSTSGEVVSGTEIIWKGIVTGSTSIGSLTRVAGATDTGNAIGDYVMLLPTSDWGNQLVTGLLVEHTQGGLHALTSSSTMTSPKVITSLNDTNGNELVKVTATASAVNEVTVANAAAGNGPTISATGDDTNVDLNFVTKGTGKLKGVVNNLFNPYKFLVYRNAALTTSSNATLKITFDTKVFDTGTNYDATTNFRFTAPVAGYYVFSGAVSVQAFANDFVVAKLKKNGSDLLIGTECATAGTSGNLVSMLPPVPVLLAASDTIEVYMDHSVAGNSGINTGSTSTFFGGYLLSAT